MAVPRTIAQSLCWVVCRVFVLQAPHFRKMEHRSSLNNCIFIQYQASRKHCVHQVEPAPHGNIRARVPCNRWCGQIPNANKCHAGLASGALWGTMPAMKRNTRECVHLLVAGLQREGALRRDQLAEASGLSAEETTRALKAARQMCVVDYVPHAPDALPGAVYFNLTGRPLPPARRSTRMPTAPADRFQALLEAWNIPSGA